GVRPVCWRSVPGEVDRHGTHGVVPECRPDRPSLQNTNYMPVGVPGQQRPRHADPHLGRYSSSTLDASGSPPVMVMVSRLRPGARVNSEDVGQFSSPSRLLPSWSVTV